MKILHLKIFDSINFSHLPKLSGYHKSPNCDTMRAGIFAVPSPKFITSNMHNISKTKCSFTYTYKNYSKSLKFISVISYRFSKKIYYINIIMNSNFKF